MSAIAATTLIPASKGYSLGVSCTKNKEMLIHIITPVFLELSGEVVSVDYRIDNKNMKSHKHSWTASASQTSAILKVYKYKRGYRDANGRYFLKDLAYGNKILIRIYDYRGISDKLLEFSLSGSRAAINKVNNFCEHQFIEDIF